MFWLFAAASEAANQGSIDMSSVLVAVVAALATLGSAYVMFRGKTQDTANWLIVELRNEAKSARESASDCERHREEDRKIIEDLRGTVLGLQSVVRKLDKEKGFLREEIDGLHKRIESIHGPGMA